MEEVGVEFGTDLGAAGYVPEEGGALVSEVTGEGAHVVRRINKFT
ncbi:hypothetical protein AB0G97_02585 [Streptomyces sp. NPDC020755]